jgi:hypothetical protein
LFITKFGIEIEFTGITRIKAATTIADYFGVSTVDNIGGFYGTQQIRAPDGRLWKLMSDASIKCQKKSNRQIISADSDYSVELVSPILTYHEDIKTIQEIIRRLRKAGGFVNKSCGIHIHLNGEDHTPRSIRNFINIIASKNDLFYKALQIAPERQRYCMKMDAYLVEEMNRRIPTNFNQIKDIWYGNFRNQNRTDRYNTSRYYFLNLHSFFRNGIGSPSSTVELRGFNAELHAGKVRAYIVLALALNNQALTQTSASSKRVQSENEKFAMRVYLNRIGFIGDEFKSCREHLYLHLDGNAAWRYGRDLRNDVREEVVNSDS